MTDRKTEPGAWRVVGLLFFFMLINFADKAIIGLAAVRSIALSVHVFRNFENIRFKGFSAHQLWNDALRCAQIARLIMQLENSDENQVEDAGTAAMLRNAGKLMLAQSLPRPFQQAIALAVLRQERNSGPTGVGW